ncbi:MAG: Transcriptional regulator, AcrR family [uncultured Rubrobacteraceae bacterium]|uniref:Transcriptional regulator, AcrR family n=1 Tax=uncultured Rubrobacteraceae bacterium TaxID=349277 RepID=A0A6J4P5V2_9ACTN|nr:MAG: Transcriptional regulator, AcrR family [uncultured Rubrobacteraceae bacterium]CAA9454848.1 MAG: Transcriptional regulator, AcrR family [uncultured Rubrobacteraceae bacterium]
MTGERKQTRRKRVGKAGLLSAARELAAEEGWGAVSVRKIADRVGYRAPVVYEYFESKDDLLFELLKGGFGDLARAVRAAREDAPDAEGALYAVARAYLRFAWGSPDLYQVMYGLGGVPFAASETWEEGQRVGDEVGLAVEEAMRGRGKEATDVAEEVLALWAAVHGLVALTMAGRMEGGEEQAERLGEKAVRDALAAWKRG